MKTCPTCHKTYEDESLVFCLDDGTKLAGDGGGADANATWHLPAPGPTVASPRQTSPPAQPTITARPEHFQVAPAQIPPTGTRDESRRSALPWVFAIVLVLGASGVLMAWLMTRGRTDDTSRLLRPTPTPVATLAPSTSETAAAEKSPSPNLKSSATPIVATREPEKPSAPTPVKERPKPQFAVLNNITFNGGSRITYYPRPSFGSCQADCAGNANCKALTWIRPGAYNPSDPGMCYLMYSVTDRVSHACCISAVKN